MPVNLINVPTSQIVQTDQPHENIVFSEQEGVLYAPNLDVEDEQDAYFTHTLAPPLTDNFAWNHVKINWTRSYDSTPNIFRCIFTLEGIHLDGSTEVIGEKFINNISGTSATEDIIFDLYNNRSTPSFRKTGTGAPSGKIQLNLPKKWLYFQSIDLVKAWLDDWNGRRRYTVTNNSSSDISAADIEITVPYLTMNSDFSDIRFTDNDSRTLLCYGMIYYTASSTAVFMVRVPNLGAGETRTIFIYYAKPTATYQGNIYNLGNYYDDWEDGKYTSRSSPYQNWGVTGGTLAIETSNPIINKSLKHTGTADPECFGWIQQSVMARPFNKRLYNAGYHFKLLNQGTGNSAVPYINLWQEYQDNNNRLKLYAYYTGSNTNLKIRKWIGGSVTDVVEVLWLSGQKIPTGTVYRVEVEKNGNTYKVWINGSLKINTSTSGPSNPNKFGMGINYSGVAVFESFRIRTINPDVTVSSIGGTREGKGAIPLEVTGENNMYGYFTIPSSFVNPSIASLETTEIDTDNYQTNDLLMNTRDKLDLGYNSVDRYVGMRLSMNLKADRNCNVRINSVQGAYEVI